MGKNMAAFQAHQEETSRGHVRKECGIRARQRLVCHVRGVGCCTQDAESKTRRGGIVGSGQETEVHLLAFGRLVRLSEIVQHLLHHSAACLPGCHGVGDRCDERVSRLSDALCRPRDHLVGLTAEGQRAQEAGRQPTPQTMYIVTIIHDLKWPYIFCGAKLLQN